MLELNLKVCGCRVSIESSDLETNKLLFAGYGAMSGAIETDQPALHYTISRTRQGFRRLTREGTKSVVCKTDYDFIYHFEKDLTLALQHLRSDLFFVHAGVMERNGQAVLFSAPSGTGKSTLCFALLHQGFGYLSDELAPIDLNPLHVQPFPHALCMKGPPPAPYSLPARTFNTERTLHVPIEHLPTHVVTTPLPLALVVLIQRNAVTADVPAPRRLSAAEGATRLYVNVLNALAHPGDGLDAALSVTHQVPCYELDSSALEGVGTTIDNLLASS